MGLTPSEETTNTDTEITKNTIVNDKQERDKLDATTEITIPPHVFYKDIIEKKKEAQTQLYENLKTRGYCPIKVDSSVIQSSEKLSEVSFQYLAQDMELKKSNIEKDKNNIGYVNIPGVREYIKLRPTDPEDLWPTYPTDFKEAYNAFFHIYSQIAFNSFDLLANYVEEGKSDPLIKPEHVSAIVDFIKEKSSVSMIKYFELKEAKEVCGEHTDTGILTFITRTILPSLEIWDKKELKFVKIEELLDVGDVIAFVSEKIPLFSCSNLFTATPHRVRMNPGGERMSIAFLLDVAK